MIDPFEDMICALVRLHAPPRGWSVEDLEQVARIAAWQALETWDPRLGLSRHYVRRRVLWAISGANRMRDRLATVSLERPIGDELTLEDTLASEEPTPHETIEREELLEWLERALSCVSTAERIAVLAEDAPAVLGVTRQRVHQIRQETLAFLRRCAARDRIAA